MTRIASLLASATEIVAALGLAEQLVGISHECDYPADILDRPRLSRPRFDPAGLTSAAIDTQVRQAMKEHGSVYVIDAERLAAVRPDLILTQAVCEVCAVPTVSAQEAAEQLNYAPKILSLDSHDLGGIHDTVLQVGRAAGVEPRAQEYVTWMTERVAAVRVRVANRRLPRVLALEWLDPPFLPGHWVPEMIEAAGGTNICGRAGERSREVNWSALAGCDPDVLVIMPCGFGLEASLADASRHAAALRALAGRAIESRRAFVVDGSSYFNRSGPRVVDGIEILAALFHPDAVTDVSLACRAELWQGE
ncbi:MAG: ABC transporter substrate-binding protein [Gemmatimonadaceae bacterium]